MSQTKIAALVDYVLSSDDAALIREAIAELSAAELKEVARGVLRVRAREAVEILRASESCHQLLAGGGYDPIELLETLTRNIGARAAQMDIAPQGGGGSQMNQGYDTRIRFGPVEFLTGTSLDGMTVHESQLQVILHELAHAAGDVIPPDGGNPAESVRNQERITRACLPEVYERIGGSRNSEAGSRKKSKRDARA